MLEIQGTTGTEVDGEMQGRERRSYEAAEFMTFGRATRLTFGNGNRSSDNGWGTYAYYEGCCGGH